MLIATPIFGKLIGLLESVSEVLYSLFQMRYPHVTVGRPQRLYDAQKRIAGPTCKSLRGSSKLSGSALSGQRSGYLEIELNWLKVIHAFTIL